MKIERNGLLNLGYWLMQGNKIVPDMIVLLEKRASEFTEARLIDYVEIQKEYTPLTLCRVSDNTATVEETESGKVHFKYPFSMIYLPK